MISDYDNFNYPSFWKTRGYEYNAEILAINKLIKNLPDKLTILDVGAGYGRLISAYKSKAKKIILNDVSGRLLSLAKIRHKKDNINIIKASLFNLDNILKKNSIDLIIFIRVAHHLNNLEKAFETYSKILKSEGYVVFEFANKLHFKAMSLEFIKGNFTFPFDLYPKILSKNKKANDIPFINYHPEKIFDLLNKTGFEIVDVLSVSNFRNRIFKLFIPSSILLIMENFLQKFLARMHFGPSIFLLLKKL